MDDGGGIHGLAVLLSRAEANLARRGFGGLIESITQSLHYALDLHFARCCEGYLQKYFPFDFLCPSFIRIYRLRFE